MGGWGGCFWGGLGRGGVFFFFFFFFFVKKLESEGVEG